eukprot:3338529-Rhodomonas_salina.1
MAPAKIIEPLVAERTQAVACYPGKRCSPSSSHIHTLPSSSSSARVIRTDHPHRITCGGGSAGWTRREDRRVGQSSKLC